MSAERDRWLCDQFIVDERCNYKARFHVRGGGQVRGVCGTHLASTVATYLEKFASAVIKPFDGIRETV